MYVHLRISTWIIIFFIHCGGIVVGLIIDFTVSNTRWTSIIVMLTHRIQLILMHISCTILTGECTIRTSRRWQQTEMWTQCIIWRLIACPAIHTSRWANCGILLEWCKRWSQWCTQWCCWTICAYVTCFARRLTLTPFRTTILQLDTIPLKLLSNAIKSITFFFWVSCIYFPQHFNFLIMF